jgi:transposase-like protein
MPRSGPRAVRKYSDEFKLTAVRLSQQPRLQVKSVAAALTIHPFMLSKWRKDARVPAATMRRAHSNAVSSASTRSKSHSELPSVTPFASVSTTPVVPVIPGLSSTRN